MTKSVYAARIARMLFLRQSVSEQHPVLQMELCLIKMAEDKLRLEIQNQSNLEIYKNELKFLIKRKLKDLSPEFLSALTDEIETFSFDALFSYNDRLN